MTKTGGGLLTLTGANGNAFTGPVTVAGGTLLLDNGNGSTTHYNSANFNINGPSTLTFKSSAGAGSRNDLNARTFTFDATGGGTVNTTGPINWVVSNNTFVTNGGATDTLATSINLNSGSITFNTAVRGTGLVDLDVTAALGNSGAAVTKNGPGILRFAGSNSFAGALAINAGTLIIASSTALGTSASATTVAAGAMLDLNGQSAGAEALTLNGTGILSAGALINSSAVAAGLNGNVTMATASSIGGSGDITLGGVVSGPGLEKVGAGTLTLSNANTFTGAATVSQGALLINGTTPAAGLINVSASATLGGGGSGGVATLADGAVLSPGNADGNTGNLFILAGLSMAADSVFRFEPGTPSNSYYTDPGSSYFTDHVTVNEALTLNGRILVAYRPDLSSYDLSTAVAGDRWLVASYTGALTDNTLEIDPASAPLAPGLVYQVNTTSNPGYVYVEVAVPEAGSAALLALGLRPAPPPVPVTGTCFPRMFR
ncbi:MAG: autotransporter-associated beta strand repeat-containing protein [Kiritimatiellia bacterium]